MKAGDQVRLRAGVEPRRPWQGTGRGKVLAVIKLAAGEFALVDWHGSALWDPADRLQSVTVKRPAEEAAAAP